LPTATPTRTTRRGRVALAVGAAAAMAATQVGVAAAEAPPERGIDRACSEEAQSSNRFGDVPQGATHAGAIDCLWNYEIVQGRVGDDGTRLYDPGAEVTRQQMASFVANHVEPILDRWHRLPATDDDADDRFTDGHRVSAAHDANVTRLHEAEIVQGYEDGTFRPGVDINRGQMASFVVRAVEDVLGRELPRTVTFTDIQGTHHQENIEKLASVGIAQGTGQGQYEPAATTTRAQMASFMARALDLYVEEGVLQPVDVAAASPGAAVYVEEADTGEHEGHDRAAFHVTGEGQPGWNARYVDDAVQQGSGHDADVDGDAVIEIRMTGAAYPEEGDDFWSDDITVDGDGIVEVVHGPIFEGIQQIFVGTTGVNSFSLDHHDGGFHIDVTHDES
jgi:hypothetical protein